MAGVAGAVVGAVAGAVVDAVNDHAIPAVEDHVISVAKEKFRSVWFLKKEIDKISKLRDELQRLREVAEIKQLDDNDVREWLLLFKNAVYDVEDVLCDYTRMVVRVEDSQGVLIRWMEQAKDGVFLMCAIPFSCLEDITLLPATPRIEIASRISFINENLKSIGEKSAVLTSESSSNSDAIIKEKSMWRFQERTMMGRDKAKAHVRDALLKHAERPCSKLLVIGIVGAGGMGKTTLAHYIYNDEDVMAAYDVKKFLKVGQKMDIKRIMNEIIGDSSNLQSEDNLQSAMEKNFKQKSVLIILDDAWCMETDVWDLLRVSLSNNEKPHSLIVTARNKGAPRMIQHDCEYIERELVAMPDNECRDVFKRWVLKGKTDEKFNEWPWFEDAVKKLKGVPLAAEIMGRLLSDNVHDTRKCWYILSNMREEGNVVDQIAGLSYLHLPSYLKPCFAYCAMLPIGYRFDKEELVRMWIAQGYIPSDRSKLMEDIGKEYFDDLHQRSLFQSDYDVIDAQTYTMHDLIHEFARKVYREGCQVDAYEKCSGHNITIEKLSKEIRHMSLVDERLGSWRIEEEKFKEFKKLRTLICYDTIFTVELANQFKYLRLLIIDPCAMEELPNSVRHLKLLQYLDVSKTKIKSLPESMCDLVDLKFLNLPDCCAILPEGMSKLLKLRFVKRGRSKRGEYVKIKGVGKLASLQGCNLYFTVRNESEWQISELKGLNHLHGTLTIVGLECVRSGGEAEQAFLSDKSHLQKLVLGWNLSEPSQQQDNIVDGIQESSSWSSDSETEVLEEASASSGQQEHVVDSQVRCLQAEEVLEGLRPHSRLESLAIYNHRGARPPNWLKDECRSLVELELDGCCNWESLSMPTRLQKLSINKAGKLRSGGGGVRTGNAEDTGCTLPNLKELRVKGCPMLTTLCQIIYIRGSKNLENFEIVNCPKLVSLEKQDGHRHGSPLPLLWKFSIKDCPKLASLSPINLHSSEKLKVIKIVNCPELVSLEEQHGYGCGRPFPYLWKLSISDCPKLTSLSPIILRSSGNLQYITIMNCPELMLLEEEEGGRPEFSLPFLKELNIEGCPKLNLPSSVSLPDSSNLPQNENVTPHELPLSEDQDGDGRDMAVEIADAVIDPVISAVEDHIISVAKEEFKGVRYLRDDMDKTSNLVQAIQGWREVAEKKQLEHESVREWLSDFKNVVYDIEDVVCDYREMVVEAEDGSGVVARWMVQAKDGLFLLCGIPLSCLRDILPLPVTPRIEISHRLRTINKNLIKIEERRVELAKFVGESSGHSNSAATVAPQWWKYEERIMIGRKEMKAEIKKALLKHSRVHCSKLLVVGIVGAGGMGKTTLAHGIFNDEDVKKAFEVNKWQYVGEKFDIKKIMNNILDKKDDEKMEDPTELHLATRKKFKEKSVLVVLDDAWSTNDEEWELLQSSLSNEAKAHTLIVTARNKAVTQVRCLDSEYLEHELVAMPKSECMEVFKSYAFMGKKDVEEKFEGLSNQVVEKLKGIPLAARMMGGFLNKYLKDGDRHNWLSIVNNMELPNTKEGNVVDKITGLSYLHLSQPLRCCFAYCAMFVKGFEFNKENLVQMWIAQGYIHPPEKELMENIGKNYFEDLCQMSLLQLDKYDSLLEIQYYTMHDLIHDFAQKIFKEGCQLKASDTINNLSEKVRHLSIEGREFEPSLNVYRKLRTLIICDDVAFLNSKDVPANQFRYLRVLILNSRSIEELPDSIRHLKFLRYLNLSKTQIESLPEAVCDLINLQSLILPYEYYKVWPEGMSKLVKLRHLEHPAYIKSIKDIGKLTSLQGYIISLTILNKTGWRITELKELNHLHGTLAIWGLKHVKNKREAEEACLKDKVYLEKLWLHWDLPPQEYWECEAEVVEGETSVRAVDESSQVLEALSPPPFLTSLHILVPQQLPRWMDHLPSTLVRLKLDSCGNWERLPRLGRLPSLKKLKIHDLRNLKKIGPEFYGGGGGGENVNASTSFFPRLEEFRLFDMDWLEEWEININDDDEIDRDEELQHLPASSYKPFSMFPSLSRLDIYNCPKLRTLSSVLPHLKALKSMRIEDCDELTWSVEQNEGGDRGLIILPSLNRLWICNCPKLVLSPASLSMKEIASKKQKIVIRLQMEHQKKRAKAMKIAVGAEGVQSVAIEVADKNRIVVVGEGVDPVALVTSLRKLMGFAELVRISHVKEYRKIERRRT